MIFDEMNVITEEIVKNTAKIMGENSAAAKCLKESKKYKDPIYIKIFDSLIVMSKETFNSLIVMSKETFEVDNKYHIIKYLKEKSKISYNKILEGEK